MPFSMDATMHQFEPTKDGGLMVVTVHDGDARQVAQIALACDMHLWLKALRSRSGRFAILVNGESFSERKNKACEH
jgi:hypothetical protein